MDSNYNESGTGNIADTEHQRARQLSRTRVVGQRERRVDARPLVTGAPVYAAEFEQPEMLHARIPRLQLRRLACSPRHSYFPGE